MTKVKIIMMEALKTPWNWVCLKEEEENHVTQWQDQILFRLGLPRRIIWTTYALEGQLQWLANPGKYGTRLPLCTGFKCSNQKGFLCWSVYPGLYSEPIESQHLTSPSLPEKLAHQRCHQYGQHLKLFLLSSDLPFILFFLWPNHVLQNIDSHSISQYMLEPMVKSHVHSLILPKNWCGVQSHLQTHLKASLTRLQSALNLPQVSNWIPGRH